MRCIPGGSFTDAGSGPNTPHVIDTLLFDIREVTLAEFEGCVDASACDAPNTGAACVYGGAGDTEHPVNCVDWEQAGDFCAWVGKRLPTEWEWEWAARGGDEARIYPWGAQDPAEERACWSGATVQSGSCVTGAYPQGDSRDGLSDLSGNVAEWTSSDFDGAGTYRVLRGGNWFTSNATSLQSGSRASNLPSSRSNTNGLRCVRDP
jgi:formylglycine-generating enzyme required for sulfatase activity